MDYLLVIGIILVVFGIVARASSKTEAIPDKLVIEKKACPPHKWEWQDIVDQQGNLHDARLICKVCAQTPGSL